jgi:hypothetical protein
MDIVHHTTVSNIWVSSQSHLSKPPVAKFGLDHRLSACAALERFRHEELATSVRSMV